MSVGSSRVGYRLDVTHMLFLFPVRSGGGGFGGGKTSGSSLVVRHVVRSCGWWGDGAGMLVAWKGVLLLGGLEVRLFGHGFGDLRAWAMVSFEIYKLFLLRLLIQFGRCAWTYEGSKQFG